MPNVEGGDKGRSHNLDVSTIRMFPDQRRFGSGIKKTESQPSQALGSSEFLLSSTQSGAKGVTKADLRVLRYYSLLHEFLVDLYPEEIVTSVAYMDRQRLKEKVEEAYERLVNLSTEELPMDEKRRATRDLKRVTKKVEEIEAASPKVREELLRKQKYQNEKKYLLDHTLGHF